MSGKHRKKATANQTGSRRLLIDAYNVIYADPVLTEALAVGAEKARNDLRTACRGYLQRHSFHRIVLIFDGDSSVGCVPEKSREQHLSERDGIRELFTRTGETADTRIQQYVETIINQTDTGKDPGIIVVSNDIEVIEACRIIGADILSPGIFLQQCRPRIAKSAKRSSGKKRGELSSGGKAKLKTGQEADIAAELEAMFGDDMDTPLFS